jgi:NitT/TauT family transport system substrate-binding protein
MQSRRRFLTSTALAAGAAFVSQPARAAEPPPEVTTVRLTRTPALCVAPTYVAEELLRAEGFTTVEYKTVTRLDDLPFAVGRGEADFFASFVIDMVVPLDAGAELTTLAGVHVGCNELFAADHIRSIADLKGARVGVQALGSAPYTIVMLMARQVGLDPRTDINWVSSGAVSPMELFAEGKIDAFLGFPPEPQMLRARNIGRVIVNTAVDRPWSQYFCCLLTGNRRFVRKYPIATKRVVRAILKANELCASEPARAASNMVERGFIDRQDLVQQALTELPYGRWRDYDPEDTMRFYALRLHEAGVIKASPQKILAEGSDWRFWNELKRELKA